jgi:hypothetical protein
MGSRLGRWLLSALPGLVLAAVVLGFVYFAIQGERAEVEQRLSTERAVQASRGALFARGQLGEMLSLCRSGWANLSFSHEPVALAFTRQGVDAYFWQGSDESSLRLVRCDASGVSRGPRVSHPLHGQLPAEAPSRTEQETSGGEWLHAVEQASSISFGAGDAALELLRHPVTGRVLTRRWRSGTSGATATVEPADAPTFASLLSPGQVPPAPGSAVPASEALKRWRWTVDTEAAFAFLEKAMPKGARISELRLEDDEIELRIEHPTPGADGDPLAPYGDKSFDEYAVAESDWWYPRTEPGFGCAKGLPLQNVHAQFIAAKATVGRLAWAWFSCSTAYSDGRNGVWHLVPAGPS